MPFANFEDWEDCMRKLANKYPEKEKREKVCGKLKAKVKDSDWVELQDAIKRGKHAVCLRKLKSVGFTEEEAKVMCATIFKTDSELQDARTVPEAGRVSNISLKKYATVIRRVKTKKKKPEGMSLGTIKSELAPKNINKLQTKMEREQTEEQKLLTEEEKEKRATYAVLQKKEDSDIDYDFEMKRLQAYLVFGDSYFGNANTKLKNIVRVPVILAREMVQYYPSKKEYHFKPYGELVKSIENVSEVPIIIEHPDFFDEKDIIGKVINLRADENKRSISGDAILTESMIPKPVKDKLDKNQSFPVSIGFMANVQKDSGKYMGQKYDAIQKDIDLNHLAVCIESIARCPDGYCGLNVDSEKISDSDKNTIIRRMPNIVNIHNLLKIKGKNMTKDKLEDYDKEGYIEGDEPEDFYGALGRLRKFMEGTEVIEPTKKYWNRFLTAFVDSLSKEQLNKLIFSDTVEKEMEEKEIKAFEEKMALKDSEIEELKTQIEDMKKLVEDAEKIKAEKAETERQNLVSKLKELNKKLDIADSEDIDELCVSKLNDSIALRKELVEKFGDRVIIMPRQNLNDGKEKQSDRIDPSEIFKDTNDKYVI